MQRQRRAGPRQLAAHAALAAAQGAAKAQPLQRRAAVGQLELEVHHHALRTGRAADRCDGLPLAAAAELGVGVDDREAVHAPFAHAAIANTVDGLDLDPAEILAAKLEVVDHDVERRHAGRRLHEQFLDRRHLCRRQRQLCQPGIDAAGAGGPLRRAVLDVSGELFGLQGAAPGGIGAVLADAGHQAQSACAQPC